MKQTTLLSHVEHLMQNLPLSRNILDQIMPAYILRNETAQNNLVHDKLPCILYFTTCCEFTRRLRIVQI